VFAGATWAQQRVDSLLSHERLLCIVPMVGAGKPDDPKRPAFAPRPGEADPKSRTAILGYTYRPSDDGQWALVEFVARDRAAFRNILADARSKSFLRGKATRTQVETEFRKLRKDFDLSSFRGVALP
jgi:hypothetical protein